MSSDKPGGMDLQAMLGQVMQQARGMQGRVQDMQGKVKHLTVEGGAGGGIVKVTATGDGKIKTIRIDPVAVDKRDVEMLEDLLVAGVNDALRRAGELMEKEMGEVAGGLDLGGLGDMLGKLGT